MIGQREAMAKVLDPPRGRVGQPEHRRRRRGRLAAAATLSVALLAASACAGDDAENDGGATAARDDRNGAPATSTSAPTDGSSPAAGDDAAEAWPVPDWSVTDASAAGLDQASLDAMAADAEAAGSNCLVVTRHGELVAEWYWNGWDEESEQEIFSATKSITSTLVGLAADRGLLSLDDAAADYIPEWKGTPSEAVTIRNLVSNDSGRYQDMVSDYVTMTLQEPDKTAYAVGLDQQFDPGTQWVYNNAAIQTLDRVLEQATGMPTHEFARQALFEPLGMASHIATDESGGTFTYMGGQASCRDLARFGLLFLRGGEWDGEQLLSTEWVEEATHPSQTLNPNYGFLWWLFGDRAGDGGGATPRGGTVPDSAGREFYAALGLGNQVVAVFPDEGVVATRLGIQNGVGRTDPTGPQFSVAHLALGIYRSLGQDVDPAELGAEDSAVATGG